MALLPSPIFSQNWLQFEGMVTLSEGFKPAKFQNHSCNSSPTKADVTIWEWVQQEFQEAGQRKRAWMPPIMGFWDTATSFQARELSICLHILSQDNWSPHLKGHLVQPLADEGNLQRRSFPILPGDVKHWFWDVLHAKDVL